MRKVVAALVVLTAAAFAFGCQESPTALDATKVGSIATTPTFAMGGVEKVAVCHLDKTSGLFALLNIPVVGQALEKHLAHGDGLALDADCTLVVPAGCYDNDLTLSVGDLFFNGRPNEADNLELRSSTDGSCSPPSVAFYPLVAPAADEAAAEAACRALGWTQPENLVAAGWTGFPDEAWYCRLELDAVVRTAVSGLGPFDAVQAFFTPPLTGDVVGQLASAGGLACAPLPDMTGKIALILRGTCFFSDKVANAQGAGAIGVIIYNHTPGEAFVKMGGTLPGAAIPAVFVSYEAGLALEAGLLANPPFDATLAPRAP